MKYEKYPDSSEQSSRFVLLVNDFEVRDRIKESVINKLLHIYVTDMLPRRYSAKMVSVGFFVAVSWKVMILYVWE